MAKSKESAINTNASRNTYNAPPLPLRAALSLLVLRVMCLRIRPVALHLEKCLYGCTSCTSIYVALLLLEIRVDADLVALYPRGRRCVSFPLVRFFVSL